MPESYLSNIDLGDGTTRIIRDRLAISTEASQDITDTQKSNARENLGLGTASTRSVPSNGNANATQVVLGSDTRLTNARPCADNFVGSTSQWNALSSSEKDQYNTVDLTNDSGGGGGGSGTDDYTDLTNKPQINGVTLSGDKSSSDLKLQGEMQVTELPTASESLVGTVLQYIGVTDNVLTHNYFYECVTDGELQPTYSWTATSVQAGGGGGGSTYTAGDGIDITNDVISTDNLQSGDMDDIVATLPSIPVRHLEKYSTNEQIVGEWIDGKTLYQTTYTGSFPSSAGTMTTIVTDISNVAEICDIKGVGYYTMGTPAINYAQILPFTDNAISKVTKIWVGINSSSKLIVCGYNNNTNCFDSPWVVTIKYTKTT